MFKKFLLLLLLVCVGGGLVLYARPLQTAWNVNWGNLYFKRGDTQTADALFLLDCKINAAAREGCVRALVMQADFAKVRQLVAENLNPLPPHLAGWLVNLAEENVRAQEFVRADSILNLVSDYAPGNAPESFWIRVGQLYVSVGANEKALVILDSARNGAKTKRFGASWYEATALLFRLGAFERVIERVAPELENENGPAAEGWRQSVYLLGASYQKLGRMMEADVAYRRLAATYPNGRDWSVFQALLFVERQDLAKDNYDAAAAALIHAFDLALEIPDTARSEYEAAAWKEMQRWVTRASGVNEQNARMNENFCNAYETFPGCYFLRGRYYAAQGEMNRAVADYQKACYLAKDTQFIPPRHQSVFMLAQPECVDLP